MNPEEAIFRKHVDEPAFQSGMDRGYWGFKTTLDAIVWPRLILWVRADQAVATSALVYLQFDLQGYPLQAPTARPWNPETDAPLAHGEWPKGGGVSDVFRTAWNNGVALYAPCDRLAMPNHAQWKSEFPETWWQPTHTIVVYLRFIHARLNRFKYGRQEAVDTAPPVDAPAA